LFKNELLILAVSNQQNKMVDYIFSLKINQEEKIYTVYDLLKTMSIEENFNFMEKIFCNCVKTGNVDTIKLFESLLKTNISFKVLYEATKCGEFQILKHFIQGNIVSEPVLTKCLNIAVTNKHTDIVIYLIDCGANIHTCDNIALDYLVEIKRADLLLHSIVNCNCQNCQYYLVQNYLH